MASPKDGSAGSIVAPQAPADPVPADAADPGAMGPQWQRSRERAAEKPPAGKPTPEPGSEEAANDGKKNGWIEFVLIDEDDNPVPGEPYKVTLPDGTPTTGTTDEKGLVRIEGIDPGSCKITFPRWDKSSWDDASVKKSTKPAEPDSLTKPTNATAPTNAAATSSTPAPGGASTSNAASSGSTTKSDKAEVAKKDEKTRMEPSESGLIRLKNREGFVPYMYNDPGAGRHCTVGFGHLVHKGPCTGKEDSEKPYFDDMTQEGAERLFAQDLRPYVDAINDAVTVKLNQDQFDALVSYTYNVGVEGFKGSQVLKTVNSGKLEDVPAILEKSKITSDGVVLDGLVKRRAEESEVFQGKAKAPKESYTPSPMPERAVKKPESKAPPVVPSAQPTFVVP
ncbi:MAG: glycoside hydrolase family protein [Phycisphaerales bacterium]